MTCRRCGAPLAHTVIDLGLAPPSNAYLSAEALTRPEARYPLRVMVCDRCWLVQADHRITAETLFTPDYAYHSSTSASWSAHARAYVQQMIARLGLDASSQVIEIAANDGYLLRHVVAAGIPCLGIEPTAGTAAVAEALGIPIRRAFFDARLGAQLAAEGRQADLLIGNNVYAHVPDIDDFTRGMQALLKPEGIVTLEFPHLHRLIEQTQFDTIYHEHYTYLSLRVVARIFAAAGLRVWAVEELPTHGGSLRVFGCHVGSERPTSDEVARVLHAEQAFGLEALETYQAFEARARRIREDFLAYLRAQREAGRRVAAYGAAAKGNTLLNFAGVTSELLAYVCDRAPTKQGKWMPGSRIPIVAPERLTDDPPDDLVILPWNLADEVREQQAALRARGVRFVTAVPELRVA